MSNLPELLKDFTENAIPEGLAKAEAEVQIVVDLAGCEAAEAATAAMVEVLGSRSMTQWGDAADRTGLAALETTR